MKEDTFRQAFCSSFGMGGTAQHDAQEFLLEVLKIFSEKDPNFISTFSIQRSKITVGGQTKKELEIRIEDPETGLALSIESDGKAIGDSLNQLLAVFFQPTFSPTISKDDVQKITDLASQIERTLDLNRSLDKNGNAIEQRNKIADNLKQKANDEIAKIAALFPDDPKRLQYNRDEKAIVKSLKTQVDRLVPYLKNTKKYVQLEQAKALLELFGKSVEDKITQFPKVLIIHFKRLISDFQHNRYYKNEMPVSFPQMLTEQDFQLYAQKTAIPEGLSYQLAAIVEHRETIKTKAYDEANPEYKPSTSGHYVCYGRDYDDTKKWNLYNDNVVTEVKDIDEICRDSNRKYHNYTPYLLFYERIDQEDERGRGSAPRLSDRRSSVPPVDKNPPVAEDPPVTKKLRLEDKPVSVAPDQVRLNLISLRKQLEDVQRSIGILNDRLRVLKERLVGVRGGRQLVISSRPKILMVGAAPDQDSIETGRKGLLDAKVFDTYFLNEDFKKSALNCFKGDFNKTDFMQELIAKQENRFDFVVIDSAVTKYMNVGVLDNLIKLLQPEGSLYIQGIRVKHPITKHPITSSTKYSDKDFKKQCRVIFNLNFYDSEKPLEPGYQFFLANTDLQQQKEVVMPIFNACLSDHLTKHLKINGTVNAIDFNGLSSLNSVIIETLHPMFTKQLKENTLHEFLYEIKLTPSSRKRLR